MCGGGATASALLEEDFSLQMSGEAGLGFALTLGPGADFTPRAQVLLQPLPAVLRCSRSMHMLMLEWQRCMGAHKQVTPLLQSEGTVIAPQARGVGRLHLF